MSNNYQRYNILGNVFLGNYAHFVDPIVYEQQVNETPKGRSAGCNWTLNVKLGYELGRAQFMFFNQINPHIFELVGNNINEMILDNMSLSKFASFLNMVLDDKIDLKGIRETLNISSRPDKTSAQKPGYLEYLKEHNTVRIYVNVQGTYQAFDIIGAYQITVFKDFINNIQNTFMSGCLQYDIIKNYGGGDGNGGNGGNKTNNTPTSIPPANSTYTPPATANGVPINNGAPKPMTQQGGPQSIPPARNN